MTLYAVCSARQRAAKRGSYHINRNYLEAIARARTIAIRAKRRMYVIVLYRRL